MSVAFRSLTNPNFRIWYAGAWISNVGTWMQRTAQDWLVLTQLTDLNATALGVVMSLQFGPQLLLLPWTGYAADRFERRKLLALTQLAQAILALGLGVLTISGRVQLWHVYAFALLLGCVTAFDAPVRQAFISELVSETDIANAVALNSTSFNAARMIGPAIAGSLINVLGCGWLFVLNAASYIFVIGALALVKVAQLVEGAGARRKPGGLADGFRYVLSREDLATAVFMLFLFGTFGLNFTIFISKMSVSAFHVGAAQYGMLTSTMAVGSVTGALLAARRPKPHMGHLFIGSFAFGVACAIAAVMPTYWAFGASLVLVGVSAQTVTTSTNGLVQMNTEPALRGRVLAILMAIFLGGAPLGAPIVGWVADRFGPRWALAVGAASGIAAALAAVTYLVRHGHVRLEAGRLRWVPEPAALEAVAPPAE